MLTFNFELGDFVARLRLGSKSHYDNIRVRRTSLSFNLLNILYNNGVIRGFFCERLTIKVFLKYYNGKPVIRHLQLITKPSVRAVWPLSYLARRYNAHSHSGFYVVSTTRGLLTSHECMIHRISGEVLLKVSV